MTISKVNLEMSLGTNQISPLQEETRPIDKTNRNIKASPSLISTLVLQVWRLRLEILMRPTQELEEGLSL
ncbi:hypothetical protein RRG08_065738 [Elysia crispata]|uniref:Uncharacterized protein n=1 Tax=Elysia crispata TaxID=231223 RepID=A0AAE0Z6G9_9GAST|nr:hypothetical protein RRG08_065738 [Elysia crispata]